MTWLPTRHERHVWELFPPSASYHDGWRGLRRAAQSVGQCAIDGAQRLGQSRGNFTAAGSAAGRLHLAFSRGIPVFSAPGQTPCFLDTMLPVSVALCVHFCRVLPSQWVDELQLGVPIGPE